MVCVPNLESWLQKDKKGKNDDEDQTPTRESHQNSF